MTGEQLQSSARAVAPLADYCEELKSRAVAMAAEHRATQRGYFTPSEEEAVRQLQYSYWQLRGALFDLVDSIRFDPELPETLYPQGFLTAFAGALLLVDGARFLRDTFHDLPLVRAKLDEPDPRLGIPPLMYERIQRSLVSPRHAWQLYHATQYRESHRTELDALAALSPYDSVLRVIERLEHRTQVHAATYAKTLLRVRGAGVRGRLTRDVLGRALYGLQRVSSSLISDKYVRPGHEPALPAEIREQVLGELRPGDVLIVRKQYALTNYFLPGYWPHAALYLGSAADLAELAIEAHQNVAPRWNQLTQAEMGEPRRVLESMKDGVRIRSVDSPLASDSILVVRPRLSRDSVAAALARGLAHEGKPYDFDFDFNRADRMVCTEVVYRTYEGIGGLEFPLCRRVGRNTLAASDLVRMAIEGDHLELVLAYAPDFSPEIAHGDAAVAIVRAAGEGGVSPEA